MLASRPVRFCLYLVLLSSLALLGSNIEKQLTVAGTSPITVTTAAGVATVACPTCGVGGSGLNPNTIGGIIGGPLTTGAFLNWSGGTTTGSRAALTVPVLLNGPAFCVGASSTAGAAFGASYNTYAWNVASELVLAGSTNALRLTASAAACGLSAGGLFFWPAETALGGTVDGTVLSTQTYWAASVTGSTVQPFAAHPNATVAIGATVFAGPGQQGGVAMNATERLMELPIPNAMTVTQMCANMGGATPASGSTVFTLRNTEVSTAIVVTVPLSSAAGRYCASGSVAYVGGNTISVMVVNNSGAALTGTINSITIESTPTAPMTAIIPFPKGNRPVTASTTRYTAAFINDLLNGTEGDTRAPAPRSITLSNFRCYQQTAPATNTTNITVFRNGVATAITIAATTGSGNNVVLSDTVNSVAFVAPDSYTVEWAPGAGVVGAWSGCMIEAD